MKASPGILGETCTVLEMAAGTWHAVLSLDTGGIIFEVKHGGYQPVAADDYAHWAPAEGEPGTTELMVCMRKRRWATALLPSKAINKNGMSFPFRFRYYKPSVTILAADANTSRRLSALG